MIGAVRRLDRHAIAAVAAIEQAGQRHPWTEKQLADSIAAGHHLHGIDHDGRLCGFLLWMTVLDELHVLELVIHPEQQRQGLGRQLLQYVLDFNREQGIQMAFLEVRASNLAAQRLYENLGFCETGRRRGYYPAASGREDALLMGAQL